MSDCQNEDKSTDSPIDDSVTGKTSKPKIKKKQPDQKWRWRAKEMCPIDFKLFWTYNITLVVQTNLYSVQEQGKNISTCAKEIELFLDMHILMGIMNLPNYNFYWAAETRS